MLRALLRCEKARDAVDEPELHLSKVRFAQKGERAPFGFWSGLDLVGVFLPSHSCFACWRETRILIKPDRRRHWLFSGLVTFKPRSAVLRHRNCLTQASARSFVHYFLLFTYGWPVKPRWALTSARPRVHKLKSATLFDWRCRNWALGQQSRRVCYALKNLVLIAFSFVDTVGSYVINSLQSECCVFYMLPIWLQKRIPLYPVIQVWCRCALLTIESNKPS